MTRWVCEHCGRQGESDGDAVDRIQCPDCGEPVVPR